ncbi:MAG: hypothetical protein MI741_14860 [Rhodospirillales bacterium]|nr:hypothetical protein [Rhodospirillales bacterium]
MAKSKAKSDPTLNGRTADGKFAKGNRIAKGNPHAKSVNKLRAELFRYLTQKAGGRTAGRFKAVLDSLFRMAVDRNMNISPRDRLDAARLLLSYGLGEPRSFDLDERLDALEESLFKGDK